MIQITEQNGGIIIPVKVVPNASRDRIIGELDGALKVNVSATPERGAANKALCKLLAESLGLRTSQVTIATGQTSPRKTVRITGASISVIHAITTKE
ncbi:MAG: DUF167 domain-containing protein [Planctomycetota bacterium]|nr:MAG: DUF167 domain-containing protein [Planctomycetota bacterium]